MFLILLESIFIYGILDSETDILVYTSTKFMNIIRSSHLFDNKIKFEINDNMDEVYKARLDLFNFGCIKNYNKILYLDVNAIVKDDINKVFDVCKDDILYVLEESVINIDLEENHPISDFEIISIKSSDRKKIIYKVKQNEHLHYNYYIPRTNNELYLFLEIKNNSPIWKIMYEIKPFIIRGIIYSFPILIKIYLNTEIINPYKTKQKNI
jgi:lipopolysaccharide biosynthesis glycosyltransferase